jgi:hypothetical protein
MNALFQFCQFVLVVAGDGGGGGGDDGAKLYSLIILWLS